MSVFRSYFSKNDTLIEDNLTNNSQNPVTEISYGTPNADVSRFIFDIDLNPLIQRIQSGNINPNSIQKHVLHMTNTIAFREDLIGKFFGDCITERASSFELQLFTITEDWDEGSGYDFVYVDEQFPAIPQQAANWFQRKTNIDWTQPGAFITGGTGASEVIGIQNFLKGNEDICIDVTNYINSRIFSGSSGFTGTTFGLGLKFDDDLENLATMNRRAVAFHAKNTNTFYEPYIETTFNNTIIDDRNFFFLDKDNELYLYSNVGGKLENVIISGVTIIDFEDNIVSVITSDSVENVSNGIYKITLNIDSDLYPDSVLFTDRWTVVQNGKVKQIDQEFYLIDENNYFNFNPHVTRIPDNYFFSVFGIKEADQFKRGEIRKITIQTKELYPNQNNNLPLKLQYRIFVTQSDKFQIDVIPLTQVNRTLNGFEFFLDTSWLIPQDYFLEITLLSDEIKETRNPVRFTIVSDGFTNV